MMRFRSRSLLSTVAAVLVVGVLAAILVSTRTIAEEPRATPAGRGDVVLIRCDVLGTEPVVGAFQSNSGAPVKRSASCAESLSILLKDGFTFRDIGLSTGDKAGFVVYTLTR